MAKPIVAIVGRPNVGKSTLFNRLAGKRIAIIEDKPGVTRDRIYADVEWLDNHFTLIDTGGIEPFSDDLLFIEMKKQAEIAIETAGVIVFMVDAQEGITTNDQEVAAILRKAKKPVILCCNKVDSPKYKDTIYEFYNLGLGDPIGISAGQKLNLGDLLDEIVKNFEGQDMSDYDDTTIRVAVVGKPNVGKSSLVNKILGEERSIVSDIPGTTRDAIDTPFSWEDENFVFIDTAGMRKRGKIDENIERYSVVRALSAIERADVCLMLIDAKEGPTEQDSKIAGYIHEQGKGVIVVVNKWDLIEKDDKSIKKFEELVRIELSFMHYAPIMFVSAKTGQRVPKIMEMIRYVSNECSKRIQTGVLNDVISEAVMMNQPAVSGGRRLKLYYATQVDVKPPAFALFVNNTELMHFSYERYLENQIRKAFGFEGTSLRFYLKQKNREE